MLVAVAAENSASFFPLPEIPLPQYSTSGPGTCAATPTSCVKARRLAANDQTDEDSLTGGGRL